MNADAAMSSFPHSLKIAVLWVMVVISGLSVAYVSHLCREKYGQLMVMERDANQMQVDYGKYLLEQSAWGSLQRIEVSAIAELNMRSPKPEEIVIVRIP
ncbi:MAG: cell division protein FtsL [Pseudomonadales bacterium]|jgi:cell division protein FtsL|tara:strand:+ start:447 stop:743 length:297 start_codon:yes stop_codon:yes gene_type:complete